MGKLQTRAALLLSTLLASCACAFASDNSLDVSQYAHTAWKIRDGFTKGTIFSIAQTPDGYLWLGTEFGLVRFDGVQPSRDSRHREQLPSSWINAILVARDGAFDQHRERTCRLERRQASEDSGSCRASCTALLEDAEGTLWFGVRNPGRCAPSDSLTPVLRSRELRLDRSCLVRRPRRRPVGRGGNRSVAMDAWSSTTIPFANGQLRPER